ncbi:DUF1877 family protein, partial [Streptomyces sp. NPDC005479]|uniref:DUF1877 family protein n=1 Tax=Streptomyces sp. NPDC005479 TaxID=3154879 RepID=UPI0033AF16A9
MSMIGEYFRVTAAELERAIQDSDWALDYIEEPRDVEEEAKLSPAEARYFSTYKAWHLLDFLLQRSGFPVSVIHGEELFGEADDWGYGPPRYLPADRVRLGRFVWITARTRGRSPRGEVRPGRWLRSSHNG